jgi:hypothetical protein
MEIVATKDAAVLNIEKRVQRLPAAAAAAARSPIAPQFPVSA